MVKLSSIFLETRMASFVREGAQIFVFSVLSDNICILTLQKKSPISSITINFCTAKGKAILFIMLQSETLHENQLDIFFW